MIRSFLLSALALLLACAPGSARVERVPLAVAPPAAAELAGLSDFSDLSDSTVDRPALWHPPLGLPFRVSTPYRAPPTPYAAGHRGIDFPAAAGDGVLAPVSGTVSFVGVVVDRPVLSIRVDLRTVVSLEPVEAPGLVEGDAVVRGRPLGAVASGGHCDAVCVHLGVRIDGAYVNPMGFFVEKPVLLPW